MLDQMSVEELKNRLAAYMLADESLMHFCSLVTADTSLSFV